MSGRETRLTRRLVLEEAVRVADQAGGYTEDWLPVGTLWAEIRAGSGRERAGGGMALSVVPYRIIVRHAPSGAPSRPRPDQRFRDGTRIFRILAVAEDDRDPRYLTCHATEEVSG